MGISKKTIIILMAIFSALIFVLLAVIYSYNNCELNYNRNISYFRSEAIFANKSKIVTFYNHRLFGLSCNIARSV
jgi:hypothetical protein